MSVTETFQMMDRKISKDITAVLNITCSWHRLYHSFLTGKQIFNVILASKWQGKTSWDNIWLKPHEEEPVEPNSK